MRHYPFIEALANIARTSLDAENPEWLSTAAGFHLLRLFDVWMENPVLVYADERWVMTIQALVEKAPAPVGFLLGNAVRTLMRAESSDPGPVVGPIMSYAWYLRQNNNNALAADVYETVARAIDAPSGPYDTWLAATAYLQLGITVMYGNQWDTAAVHYDRALTLSKTKKQDPVLELIISIWSSELKIQRGELGETEPLINDLITRSQQMKSQRAESLARRLHAMALQRRGLKDVALREVYTAYPLIADDIERDRALGDMAGCLAELGLHTFARQVHELLALVGLTPHTRILALANLLEITVWQKDRVAFNTTLDQLKGYTLRDEVRVTTLLYRAQGIELWESKQEAIAAYQEVVDEAEQAHVHHIGFAASEAIVRLQNSKSDEVATDDSQLPNSIFQEQAKNVLDVAEAIASLCNLRLVSFNDH